MPEPQICLSQQCTCSSRPNCSKYLPFRQHILDIHLQKVAISRVSVFYVGTVGTISFIPLGDVSPMWTAKNQISLSILPNLVRLFSVCTNNRLRPWEKLSRVYAGGRDPNQPVKLHNLICFFFFFCYILTNTILGANSTDNKLMIFYFFSRK